MTVRVQADDFDIGVEIDALTSGNLRIGGVASFIGVVRAKGLTHKGAGEQTIAAMTLEHYPGMTEKKLAEIEAAAHRRWPLEASLIVHRHGRLEPGDRIVLVITCAKSRGPALAACEFLIDWLKTEAPFWKLEETGDGEQWVEARETDDEAASKWRK